MTSSISRRIVAAGATTVALVTLAACSGSDDGGDGESGDASPAATEEEKADPVSISTNVDKMKKAVPVDKIIEVGAENGTIDKVSVYAGKKSAKTEVEGSMTSEGESWKAKDLLEPGTHYTVEMTATNEDGEQETTRSGFDTKDLTLDQQTYASIAPLDGETVGVGIPIIVQFDIPVTDKAAIEKKLEVKTSEDIEGTWSWLSDNEVHYRPKDYWPSGTKVTVNANINSVKAGPDVYGQEDRSASFTIGDSVVSTVDVAGHSMKVEVNGKVERTLPITTGKPGFETRGGTKVIMEKFDVKRMDAATTGISEDDPEYYDIPDVQWAMRVTGSGEFIHAAPWSEGSQGSDNVSHGCVGLSTSDAEWLYSISERGDVVKFVNSPRTLDEGNGWTDWNESYASFAEGSAL